MVAPRSARTAPAPPPPHCADARRSHCPARRRPSALSHRTPGPLSVQLLRNGGLRAAAVLALTVYDIDWLHGTLTVRQGTGKSPRPLG